MITRIVKMNFREDAINDFLKIFESSHQKIRSMPGCKGLKLLQSKDEPTIFFTYSIWESESDLDHYRKSDVFGSVWPQTKKLFAAAAEAWTVNERVDI